MATFEYLAVDNDGKKKRGVLEADSERVARSQLRDKKLLPIEVNATRKKIKKGGGSGAFTLQRGVSIGELSLFTRQFATLIDSGIPVEEALQAVSAQTQKPSFQAVISSLRSRVLEGHTLASSLAEHPHIFKPVYSALVASGEKSGDLGQVLDQLADYTEESQNLRSTVTQAIAYPSVLAGVSLLIVGALMVYVVPSVVSQFEDTGQALPLLTAIVIMVSDFFVAAWPFFILSVVTLFVAYRLWVADKDRKTILHKKLLALPLIGYIFRAGDAARFLQTLGIMTSSGVPLVEAIRIATDTVANLHMRGALLDVSQEVTEGKSFARALQQENQLPPIATYMVSSGERSGELSHMIKRAGMSIERELTARVQMLTSLLEPLIIVVLGGLVLMIVLAIMLPILELNNISNF